MWALIQHNPSSDVRNQAWEQVDISQTTLNYISLLNTLKEINKILQRTTIMRTNTHLMLTPQLNPAE